MQDLSEGIFNKMLCYTYKVLFLDHLLVKAEEEIPLKEESPSTGTSQNEPFWYHPYASSGKPSLESDRVSGVPAWKQMRHRQQSKKGCGKASTYQQIQAKRQKYYK